MKDTILPSANPLIFRKNLNMISKNYKMKMTVSEKIKTNNDKIKQKRAQYNLQMQTATGV